MGSSAVGSSASAQAREEPLVGEDNDTHLRAQASAGTSAAEGGRTGGAGAGGGTGRDQHAAAAGGGGGAGDVRLAAAAAALGGPIALLEALQERWEGDCGGTGARGERSERGENTALVREEPGGRPDDARELAQALQQLRAVQARLRQ